MTSLLADVGLPMIFFQFPALLLALGPIIFIESHVASRILHTTTRQASSGIGLANCVSTFVGIPLAWAAMFVLELITTGGSGYGFATPGDAFRSTILQAAWLGSYENQLNWLIPTATLVLLVPYFFASVFVERLVLVRVWKTQPADKVRTANWRANLASYALLAIVTVIWLCLALRLNH
jgi:hypothetical protein